MANGQIVGTILTVALPRILDALQKNPKATPGQIMSAVAPAIEANPVLANQVNAEGPLQSRVTWGGFLVSLGVVAHAMGLPFLSPEVQQAIPVVLEGIGAAMVFLGRWRKDLPPMTGWNPLRWIGLMK